MDILVFLSSGVAILIVLVILILVATAIIARATHLTSLSPSSTAIINTIGAVAEYGAFLAGIWIVYRYRGAKPGNLGLRMPDKKWLIAAPLICIACLAGTTAISSASSYLLPKIADTQCTQVSAGFGGSLPLAIFVVSILAPFAEETIFRGFLYGVLRGRFPYIGAAILSAAIFAALHAQPLLFPSLLALGFVLCTLYEYSGSTYPGMIVHSLFNLFGIIAILIAHQC